MHYLRLFNIGAKSFRISSFVGTCGYRAIKYLPSELILTDFLPVTKRIYTSSLGSPRNFAISQIITLSCLFKTVNSEKPFLVRSYSKFKSEIFEFFSLKTFCFLGFCVHHVISDKIPTTKKTMIKFSNIQMITPKHLGAL